MLLVSQAANGSLSARRLPPKPPGPTAHNPYPLFTNPRVAGIHDSVATGITCTRIRKLIQFKRLLIHSQIHTCLQEAAS
ncbi:unnamed protein product [Urochloa humidicola]